MNETIHPDGTVKIRGITYTLTFNRYNYDVRFPNGNWCVTFDTRSLAEAKKLLWQYLA